MAVTRGCPDDFAAGVTIYSFQINSHLLSFPISMGIARSNKVGWTTRGGVWGGTHVPSPEKRHFPFEKARFGAF